MFISVRSKFKVPEIIVTLDNNQINLLLRGTSFDELLKKSTKEYIID